MARRKKKQLAIPQTLEQRKQEILANAARVVGEKMRVDAIKEAAYSAQDLKNAQLATLLLSIKCGQGWSYDVLCLMLGSPCSKQLLSALMLRQRNLSKQLFCIIRDSAESLAKDLDITWEHLEVWKDWRDSVGDQ